MSVERIFPSPTREFSHLLGGLIEGTVPRTECHGCSQGFPMNFVPRADQEIEIDLCIYLEGAPGIRLRGFEDKLVNW